jgi:hypothetical protein
MSKLDKFGKLGEIKCFNSVGMYLNPTQMKSVRDEIRENTFERLNKAFALLSDKSNDKSNDISKDFSDEINTYLDKFLKD